MRRSRAIAFATALEVLSEPLCLLIALSAVALVALAPAVHYHQFGEASRMARDAGFSALLLGGSLYAVFGAFKTFRREVESGTMATALAHSVSRAKFFLAKSAGCAMAYFLFVVTIGAASLVVVNGAEIGGGIAAAKGDVARIWGPSLSLALAVAVVPICLAAALSRFCRFRFTMTANLISPVVALVGIAYRLDFDLFARVLPAAILFALPPVVLLAATAAFAVRFKPNVAASLIVVVIGLLIPSLGNYCLSDVLVNGGSVPVRYFWFALAAIVPSIVAFLALGVSFINGKDAA